MSDRWDPRLTEARNPRTTEIDRAAPRVIVDLIQTEDAAVPEAVRAVAPDVATLIEQVAERLRAGGRLVYVGAGTSGRLGVLDAAECPPTFGTDPSLVRGLIAGGPEALVRSVEGAEDDREAGRKAIDDLEVGEKDFVLGIATSGTTPYVHAALEEAAVRGAGVGFLSCTEPPRRMRAVADVLVTPLVGPEVIAGSTRLKAGTATKLVLNTLTTGVMIRLGKVYRNFMVDLRAVSFKLVDRGLRIVEHLGEVERSEARELIRRAGGSVKTALAMQLLGVDRALAERLLDTVDGFLGDALDRYSGSRPGNYDGYPTSGGPAETARLAECLTSSPVRLRTAVAGASGGGDGVPPSPGGWTPSDHLAHLLEFERGAVQPRVSTWSGEEPEFADFSTATPPPDRDLSTHVLLDRLDRERRVTIDALRDAGPAAWTRLGRIAGESVTLYQFLRGVAQHDAAHALRIEERVHPALVDPAWAEGRG